MTLAAADLARDLNVAVRRARVMVPARQVARFRDGACNWLADASLPALPVESSPAAATDTTLRRRLPMALLGFASRPVKIALPRLLLGRQAGLSTDQFALRTGDLGWGSTPVTEGPHVELLRLAATSGGLSDAEIRATRYWRLGTRCISLTGHFHEARDERELLQHAREFIVWGLGADAAGAQAPIACVDQTAVAAAGREPPVAAADREPPVAAADREPRVAAAGDGQASRAARAGQMPIAVAPIVDSDCYSIIDGHHQAAVAAFHGASLVNARSLRLATRTPLQAHLSKMSWLSGERHRLYQPIEAPELGRSWITVRRCDDRFAKMTAFLESLGPPPAERSYVDLACCYGWFVGKMEASGFHAVGVEQDALAAPLGIYAYGLRPDQIVHADAWDWLRAAAPRSITVVSCFSLIQHLLIAGGEPEVRAFVKLLDEVTGRVLFIDSGEAHEHMYARFLSNWNAQTIAAFLRANASFEDVIDLGPDADSVGPYRYDYGRHLFACVRAG